jgi:hypothetical protein
MARLLFFILTMLWFIYVKAGNTIPYIGLGYEVAQLPYRRGVRPVWAPDTKGIKLFQRVKVPYRRVGEAC